jgi:hypothetical protein
VDEQEYNEEEVEEEGGDEEGEAKKRVALSETYHHCNIEEVKQKEGAQGVDDGAGQCLSCVPEIHMGAHRVGQEEAEYPCVREGRSGI